MKSPVLDSRDLNKIMEEIALHARQYTPEWRYERVEDDPGAAIAQLFGEMFYQTVDRFNSVPEKLYLTFLELIGVQMPDPVPAQGMMRFNAHDALTEPVSVPRGTQVFAPGEEGEGIIYETERAIQAVSAQLKHIFYADTRQGVIQELDLARPQYFFAPNGSENLQCHRFFISQDDVLDMQAPGSIELEIHAENRFAAEETAQLLAAKTTSWSYRSGDHEVPFDRVELRGNRILLTKDRPDSLEREEDGRIYICCSGPAPEGTISVDAIRLISEPAEWCCADGAANGDTPIDLAAGGYCFGRRPTAYGLFYLRSDQSFSKRGASVALKLDVVPIVSTPEDTGPQYTFNGSIIDKKGAVEIRPDDVFVDEVVWEYYNGKGWARLPVTGSVNPFSCKDTGSLETVFTVPEDLTPVEVNAESGYYIRARVLHVENELSLNPRWIVPFVRGVGCKWHYRKGRLAQAYRSHNNGATLLVEDTGEDEALHFPAIVTMPYEPRAMYFCFDQSPHAMPLSIYLEMAGRAPLDDKLSFEVWTGKRFEPVHSLDLTRNLLCSGLMLLYLPEALPVASFFGEEGCWIRMIRSSYMENSGGYPRVSTVYLNAVNAIQRKRAASHVFDTDVYEADKRLQLLEMPVLDCEVWVDEINGLAVAEAEELAKQLPQRVRLEYEDNVLSHCWVHWERIGHLQLAGGDERVYHLDPYEGIITFGDGIRGKVPPVGQRNISVSYASGGGELGNRPVGTITEILGSLPRVSSVENLTPMCGGTDRFSLEKLEALGNKRLRHRERALGTEDFEEIVAQQFPQVLHVKCFARRDENYAEANGHVTLVVDTKDPGSVASDLCDKIYAYLEPRCSCTLTQGGRLHVIPATVVTVNTEVTVEVEDLDRAVLTQQELTARLNALIGETWRKREIGDQVRIDQIWQVVRDVPNVRSVRKILVEGVYDKNGVTCSIPLKSDNPVPYAAVRAGGHKIRLG